jgi:hypothetical protein
LKGARSDHRRTRESANGLVTGEATICSAA